MKIHLKIDILINIGLLSKDNKVKWLLTAYLILKLKIYSL